MCKMAVDDGCYVEKHNYITHFYQISGNNLISFSTLKTVMKQVKFDSYKLHWLTGKCLVQK